MTNSELRAMLDRTSVEDTHVAVSVVDLERLLTESELPKQLVSIGDLLDAANHVSTQGHLVGTSNWAFAMHGWLRNYAKPQA